MAILSTFGVTQKGRLVQSSQAVKGRCPGSERRACWSWYTWFNHHVDSLCNFWCSRGEVGDPVRKIQATRTLLRKKMTGGKWQVKRLPRSQWRWVQWRECFRRKLEHGGGDVAFDHTLVRSKVDWGRFVLYFALAPSCTAVLKPDLKRTGKED